MKIIAQLTRYKIILANDGKERSSIAEEFTYKYPDKYFSMQLQAATKRI